MDTIIELRKADIPRVQVTSAVPVLKEVDWKVERGEFWIVGALPGTGKTDLLCAAAGLQRALKGEQCLFGKDVSEMTEEELVSTRLKIGMVFTGGRLFNSLTVAQNIALPISYHGHDEAEEIAGRVSEALELTGLSEYAEKKPTQVMRGLHQRIGLARALALGPEVLIIDNPLTGVDPRQGRWWLDFLCQMNKKMTLIAAVDDLRAWRDVGSQFALLRERHFEIVGDRERIKNSADPLVHELLLPAFAQEE